jgi:hypothetical protein
MPKKWLFLAVAILLLAGIIALGLFLPHSPSHPKITFPSGATLTFVEASFGNSRYIQPNGTWQRKLAFLPDSVLKFLKINPGQAYPMDSNQMLIWLSVTPSGTARLCDTFSLVDENGAECVAPDWLTYPVLNSTTPGAAWLDNLGLNVFPRRARQFRLRFYSKDANTRLLLRGEMKIPNPASRKYPVWQPDPLPVARTNGDLAITLTHLLVGTRMYSLDPAATNEEPWGQARFTFAEGGKPTRDWAVDNIEFSDATGNRALPRSWGNRQHKPDQDIFDFRVPLWPSELAWKLSVRLLRKSRPVFVPGETWSITNLALPALNSTTVLNLRTNLSGVGLELQSLVDETRMLRAGTRSNSRQVRLVFWMPLLPSNLRLSALRVTGHDASSNTYPGDLQLPPSGAFADNDFYYTLPAAARTLDVKIGFSGQLTAEFFVKPTAVQSSNSVSTVR